MNQDKLEEILVNLYLGVNTTQKMPSWRSQLKNPEITEALTAIRKEFAVELQRIGEKVLACDYCNNTGHIDVYPSGEKDELPDLEPCDLCSEQRTRLSQIVKEMGESNEK